MTHQQELNQAVIKAEQRAYDSLVALQPKLNNPDFDKHVAEYRARLDEKIKEFNSSLI